jgi:hypothetical protein
MVFGKRKWVFLFKSLVLCKRTGFFCQHEKKIEKPKGKPVRKPFMGGETFPLSYRKKRARSVSPFCFASRDDVYFFGRAL